MQSHCGPLRTGARRRLGFTLLEVLLVLVILGVIAALVVPRLTGAQHEANIMQTRTMIAKIESSLGVYAALNNGRPPDTLDMLLEPVDASGRAMAPIEKDYPKDAWKNDLNYSLELNPSGTGYDILLWSNGPDGANNQGGGDDINNWDET
ncbi:MAG: type II secretion system protein GspG [Planctomycetaceae bacterium]